MSAQISLDRGKIAAFCNRNHISKLSLFGSVLTDRFGPESDVDVLVEFEPEQPVGLFAVARMERELSEMVGRKVDLRTSGDLSPYLREDVLDSADLQYVSG